MLDWLGALKGVLVLAVALFMVILFNLPYILRESGFWETVGDDQEGEDGA